MKLMNKLERRFGRYAIHNLPLIMILFQVIGYTLAMMAPSVLDWLEFNPVYICNGQIWRLVTWVLMPPSSLDIFTFIMLFFYYWIARTLAATWGDFYFNIYILGGVLITDIGMIIAYAIFLTVGTTGALLNISLMSVCVTTYYIQTSVLLAFALTYPDMQVLLYFFIPVKMKWMGILYGIFLIYGFYSAGYATQRIVMLLSLANFAVYFLSTRDLRRLRAQDIARRAKFRKASGQHKKFGSGLFSGGSGNISGRNGASGRNSGGDLLYRKRPSEGSSSGAFRKIYPGGARHRCTICGRTELDDPNLEFRFCSKCEGNYEYCQDHLFTHKHIKNGVPSQDP